MTGTLRKQASATIDHRRRMIKMNGSPYLGVGYYVDEFEAYYNYKVMAEKQKDLHGKIDCVPSCPTLAKALEVFTGFAQQGITQVHPYYIDQLNSSDLAQTLLHLEHHDLAFSFPLRYEAYALAAVPSSEWSRMPEWSRLKEKVELVKASPALLGYYLCDDCGSNFHGEGAARVYSALKQLDPFHLTLGATRPCVIYTYSDNDGGQLSLDYPLIENCKFDSLANARLGFCT